MNPEDAVSGMVLAVIIGGGSLGAFSWGITNTFLIYFNGHDFCDCMNILFHLEVNKRRLYNYCNFQLAHDTKISWREKYGMLYSHEGILDKLGISSTKSFYLFFFSLVSHSPFFVSSSNWSYYTGPLISSLSGWRFRISKNQINKTALTIFVVSEWKGIQSKPRPTWGHLGRPAQLDVPEARKILKSLRSNVFRPGGMVNLNKEARITFFVHITTHKLLIFCSCLRQQ